MPRSQELTAFLEASARSLRASCKGRALAAAERVIARFGEHGVGAASPTRLPVCGWLEQALAEAASERSELAAAFSALEPQVEWKRRASARPEDLEFWDGHANAMILGPGGIEAAGNLWVGVTLMAPHTRYVDHDHPPEEVYLSLSPGEWWNAEMDWTDPGPSGTIYNPPGIAHAMRAGAQPFLALWYLPL